MNEEAFNFYFMLWEMDHFEAVLNKTGFSSSIFSQKKLSVWLNIPQTYVEVYTE